MREIVKKFGKEHIEPSLCYFHIQENEEFTKILRENQRIICRFRGHTHINEVLRPESWRGKLLVDIGGYGYMGRNEGGRWIFNTFDAAWAWGYQVLVWDQTHVHIYHVKPKRKYRGENGNFDYRRAIEDELAWEI